MIIVRGLARPCVSLCVPHFGTYGIHIVTYSADNVILFAKDISMMQTMVNDVSYCLAQYKDSLAKSYFQWKPSSLEFMVSGSFIDTSDTQLLTYSDGVALPYKQKLQLIVLGSCLDNAGHTRTSIDYNLGRAESHYFKHQQTLRSPVISVAQRLQAWHRTTLAVACYTSQSWHLSKSVISALRTWELQMLRRVLRLKRRPTDSSMDYNKRTATRIRFWQQKYNVPTGFCCVLKAVYKTAWREKFVQPSADGYPIQFASAFRNTAWWETIHCFTNPQKRCKLGLQHASRGQPMVPWEHPFVEVWGPHWQAKREQCQTLKAWMKGFRGFLHVLSEKWSLPWLMPYAGDTPSVNIEAWTTVRMSAVIDDPPMSEANPRELVWADGYKRLWIQTDNKLVADAFAGNATLSIAYLQPICIRIGRKLANLLHTGWRPRLDTEAFIE